MSKVISRGNSIHLRRCDLLLNTIQSWIISNATLCSITIIGFSSKREISFIFHVWRQLRLMIHYMLIMVIMNKWKQIIFHLCLLLLLCHYHGWYRWVLHIALVLLRYILLILRLLCLCIIAKLMHVLEVLYCETGTCNLVGNISSEKIFYKSARLSNLVSSLLYLLLYLYGVVANWIIVFISLLNFTLIWRILRRDTLLMNTIAQSI